MYNKNKGQELDYITDLKEENTKMESLIAEIKSTLESSFYTEEFKLKDIHKTIQKYGY